MNRGLLYLLRKRPVARVRSMRRRLGLWKSLLLVGFVLLVLGTVVFSRLVTGLDEELERDVAMHAVTNARVFRAIGPLGILGMALLAAVGGGGLYFRKEEIDFLFPAPVSRRSLLLRDKHPQLSKLIKVNTTVPIPIELLHHTTQISLITWHVMSTSFQKFPIKNHRSRGNSAFLLLTFRQQC